ncbi:hypothetical protein BH18ACT7_BH18ACT7_06310 [soil metagenome]
MPVRRRLPRHALPRRSAAPAERSRPAGQAPLRLQRLRRVHRRRCPGPGVVATGVARRRGGQPAGRGARADAGLRRPDGGRGIGAHGGGAAVGAHLRPAGRQLREAPVRVDDPAGPARHAPLHLLRDEPAVRRPHPLLQALSLGLQGRPGAEAPAAAGAGRGCLVGVPAGPLAGSGPAAGRRLVRGVGRTRHRGVSQGTPALRRRGLRQPRPGAGAQAVRDDPGQRRRRQAGADGKGCLGLGAAHPPGVVGHRPAGAQPPLADAGRGLRPQGVHRRLLGHPHADRRVPLAGCAALPPDPGRGAGRHGHPTGEAAGHAPAPAAQLGVRRLRCLDPPVVSDRRRSAGRVPLPGRGARLPWATPRREPPSAR